MQDHLSPFLAHLRALYRTGNRYHSFVHALDVLQAVYTFLDKSGLVPPITRLLLDPSDSQAEPWRRQRDDPQDGGLLSLLGSEDIFILCLAAIGHDVGHPGNSNAFLARFSIPHAELTSDLSRRKMPKLHYLGYSKTNPRWKRCIVQFCYDYYDGIGWVT